MPNVKPTLKPALILLSALMLPACAHSPLVTAVPNPQLSPLPPSLQAPPESLNALESLQRLLERWQSGQCAMPNGSVSSSDSTTPNELF